MNAKQTVKRLSDALFHIEKNLEAINKEWDQAITQPRNAIASLPSDEYRIEFSIIRDRAEVLNSYWSGLLWSQSRIRRELDCVSNLHWLKKLFLA